ncbi:hypothetical protein PVAND_016909 [Polypedilum vanderplanki]|uniref:Uncharacterized protein n=1 Tax=Polypedilum vanderplanki TaxID=319348 RepID=A0A9J6BHS6_POLVA|nr:hypothetical protein PVAND_016909 [Polypedilum vanderplanki]
MENNQEHKNPLKRLWANDTFRMIFIAAGIMLCFFAFGIMQEKVMRGCFGGELKEGKCIDGEKYKYELTLVLVLCAWYAIFAKFLMLVNNRFGCLESPQKDKTHIGWYAAAAFCYISAMVCGNMALRWITYPTQVIAKSSKPIPVMILGVILAHKRYTIQKYIFVLLIVVGVILFIYKEGKAKDDQENQIEGLLLVGMSLLADGVLGAIEDRMRAATKPTALNFMFAINMFSAIILFVGVIATTEIVDFYHFAVRHPDVLVKIGSAAVVGSLGQIFIFMMISDFGPLPCSIVTTTRKFFTVLISVFFMGNPLIPRQWVATVIVFGALFADALFGKKHLCGPKPESHHAVQVPTEEPDIEKNGKLQLEDVELQKLKKETA